MINWEDEILDVTWRGAINDGSEFAVDASAIPDLDLAVEKTGYANLGEALFRRLITPRGGLFYDIDYGFDVRQWINDHGTEDRIYELATGIALECEKDPRVEAAMVEVVQLDQRHGLIRVECRLPMGLARFALTWGVGRPLVMERQDDGYAFAGPTVYDEHSLVMP